jgi:plasmid stabilization system protein ParE
MATIKLTSRAFSHLETIFEYLAEHHPQHALDTVRRIRQGIAILEHHPLMGRIVEEGRRELVVSRGRSTHLVLYRWLPNDDVVLVLAIRDARQAGYAD